MTNKACLVRILATAFFVISSIYISGCSDDNNRPAPISVGSSDTTSVSTKVEQIFGAKLTLLDDDGDGLTNEFEIIYGFPVIQPDVFDTDGNGVHDGNEDSDDDGLTNLEEQNNKTNPLVQDTDSDFLNDAEEVDIYGTNPLIKDSDGDGILDGREVFNSSDPLVADADRFVVSSSVIKTINYVTGETEEIKIAVSGAGDLSSKIIVTNWSDAKLDGQLGRSFDISLPDEYLAKMQTADITLPFDITAPLASDANDLAVFTISPDTNFWEELPSLVDVSSGSVTATTTHFSPFLIAKKTTFNQSLDKIPSTCSAIDDPTAIQADVVLVIDSSGSMAVNDPSNLRISASRQFIQGMKDTDRVAVVDFDSSASLLIGLSNDQPAISSALNRIDSSGGTNIGAGVSAAISELMRNSNSSVIRAIILLTDGQGSYSENLTVQMAGEGIRAFTIGLTGAVDAVLLQNIADGTNGAFRKIDSAAGLASIFTDLETVFGDDGKDDDEDGLTNCQEIQGFYFPKSKKLIQTDPKKWDSDGDGVSDGAEAGILELGFSNAAKSKPVWVAKTPASNPAPNNQDTDGDGILDPDEYRISTDAFSQDSDHDGITDFDEIEIYGTNPNDHDSDGDGAADKFEILNMSKGFDPNVFNYKSDAITKAKFYFELAKGGVSGDIIDIDTPPELYGQIVGGFFVVSDARDLIANLFKGEWLGAGLSAVGLVPVVGDAIGAGARITKFLEKFPRKRYEVVNLLEKHFDDITVIRKYLPPKPGNIGAWAFKPFARGKALEIPIGKVLKKQDGKLIGLFGNFKTIDMWNKDIGKAVSIKTLDLNAKTYHNASAFKHTINGYAKELQEFVEAGGKSVETGLRMTIEPGMVKSRELVIGIPKGLDSEYSKIISSLNDAYSSGASSVLIKTVIIQ